MDFTAQAALVLVSAVYIGLVDVPLCLFASSVSGDSVVCHFGKEGSCPCDVNEQYPGVFLSQLSHFYAPETPLTACSLLGLRHKVSLSGIAFFLLHHAKTLLWPFWPYSIQGACQTVLAVPYLFALA